MKGRGKGGISLEKEMKLKEEGRGEIPREAGMKGRAKNVLNQVVFKEEFRFGLA